MTWQVKRFAISGLRWVLGVILLLESAHFALSPSEVRDFAGSGLPPWVPGALGGSEVVAALLFLVPAASLAGGWLLLGTFVIAVAVHFLLGEFNVGPLIIYGMAVIVCMTHPNREAREAPHDRR